MKSAVKISVAIPSYQRGRILIETMEQFLPLLGDCSELLVVDQTETHPEDVQRDLHRLGALERVRWIRIARPSIPAAMNVALREAIGEIVLFVDDDVIPDSELLTSHIDAQAHAHLVAGFVLQPGESEQPLAPSESFRFNSNVAMPVDEFIGCNFSVGRDCALRLGGFDENFIGAAYRYEAEFAHRYRQQHGSLWFEPSARLRHLRAQTGGTRAHGHHLRTLRPTHSVGAYYELLRTRRAGWLRELLWRPLRAVRTRHHLRRPWWIPLTLLAELRGLMLALKLDRQGPRLMATATDASRSHPPNEEHHT